MINQIAISGFRSLRDITIELERLTVVTGANGSGKSSLYRSLRLLADVAQGRVIRSLAEDGGLQSTLWAGPESFGREVKAGRHAVEGTRRKGPISLKLGFAGDDFGYAIDLGLPLPSSSMFSLDPEIKSETVWMGSAPTRSSIMAERRGPSVRIRGETGAWRQAFQTLAPVDSMMTHCAEPTEAPELFVLRERMREWRFYEHFRTDREAAARRPQIGTHTPVLASDGADLAAAVQTILEIGGADDLREAVSDAFPGAEIEIDEAGGYFELRMRQHGLLRSLKAAELSDGTLRYLLLIAALLSPRPPELMILNEPESSLHPDLLPSLARLMAKASARSQIILVSHAPELITALEENASIKRIRLAKDFGETLAEEEDPARWTWPPR
ncbi:AAA family ATPase [Flaviflagellibacter deserti]|uniref:AAA family ATPase n=1 Tax=Flaviflagellibacter deserti TaxID=2267266 RepID=A0ABV9YX23_9HYPH